ncbi:M15 family metallopeptidase [Actinoplanes sp. NPDC049118]|uniref:M15 family metallopeptidase n=1 Tax=Actinoplanes sp. NPDC049118 TaxID=3155769 RepID=UPI0033C95E72
MKRLPTFLSALFLATAQPLVTPAPAAAETPAPTVTPTPVAPPTPEPAPAPAAPAPAPAATPAALTPAAAAPPHHVVRPGETIKSIANAHGLRRRDLRAWNGILKPNQPSVDGVLHLAKPPAGRLSGWRSSVETVTPAAINWDAKDKCPVQPADLRKVWVTYIDFYGVSHQGSIVVHQSIATRTQRAFQALYRMRFRIQGMSPMALNAPYISDMGTVTAAYSCRRVSGSSTWSQHAYGQAVDVNPVQNPMVRGTGGTGFQLREQYRRGMMHSTGAVRAFTDQGFHWGGRWNSFKDYMHFSMNNK